MGSSPSSSAGGGTLSGGKTMLAGTFLAEQTHSNPASYTLISRDALSESSRNNPRVQGGSSGGSSGSRSKMNRSRVEKSGPHCTKLTALDDIDSLLLKDEDAPQSERRARSKNGSKPSRIAAGDLPGIPVTGSKSKSIAEQLRSDALATVNSERPSQCVKPGDLEDKALAEHATDEALPHLSSAKPGRTSKTPLQSRGGFVAPATNDDVESSAPVSSVAELEAPSTSHGRLDSRPSSQKKPRISGKASSIPSRDKEAEVFNRLYICRKPWVADETDSQLLQYLATRGGTPEITSQTGVTSPMASISRSGDVSTSLGASTSLIASTSLHASTSLQMSTRSSRSKYRNHRELFDNCLHRDPSPEIRVPSAGLSPRAKTNKSTGAFAVRGGPGGRLLYSPKQLAAAQASREKSGTIQEKIKEIVPIPESSVDSFFEAEGTTSPLCSPRYPVNHGAWGASPVLA